MNTWHVGTSVLFLTVTAFALPETDERVAELLRPGKVATVPAPNELCAKLVCPDDAKARPAPERTRNASDTAECTGCYKGKKPHGPAVSCVAGRVREYDEFRDGQLDGVRRSWNETTGELVSERVYKKGVQQVHGRAEWARWRVAQFGVAVEAPVERKAFLAKPGAFTLVRIDEANADSSLTFAQLQEKDRQGTKLTAEKIAKQLCEDRLTTGDCEERCVATELRPLPGASNGGLVVNLSVSARCPKKKEVTHDEEAFVVPNRDVFLLAKPKAARFDDVEREILRSIEITK